MTDTDFDRDPASPRVRALAVIFDFLMSEQVGVTPKEAVEIALSVAGEIIACCLIGDTEAFIAESTTMLRVSIARFTRENPELIALKRRRAQ